MRFSLPLSLSNSLSVALSLSHRIHFISHRPRSGGGQGGLLPSPPLAMPVSHAMGRSVGASRKACKQKHRRVRSLHGPVPREGAEISPSRGESAMAPAMRIVSVQLLRPVCKHHTMPKGGTLEGGQAARWTVHASARQSAIAESTSQGGRARRCASLSREVGR